MLSYRRYKKLSTKEKNEFDLYRDKYYPQELADALYMALITGKPFKHKMIEWVRKHVYEAYGKDPLAFMEHYRKVVTSNPQIKSYVLSYRDVKPKYLKEEFLWRGFVPLRDFKIKPNYLYIGSNRPIEGEYYVYPKHCVNGLCKKEPSSKHPNINYLFSRVGIAGYTRFCQTFEDTKVFIINASHKT